MHPPRQRLLACSCLWLVSVWGSLPAPVLAKANSAQDIESTNPSTNSSESILVRRDLSVITPVVLQEIGPDGVLLQSGTMVPWYDILVAQNWQRSTSDGPTHVPANEILAFQQTYGQPWFLVRKRGARGETLEVEQLLRDLAQPEASPAAMTANSVAARFLLAQHLSRHGAVADAWLEWLAAEQARQKIETNDETASAESGWRKLYLDGLNLSADPITHLPNSLPFPRSWNEPQLQQLAAFADQPAAALCLVAASLSDARTWERDPLVGHLKRGAIQSNQDQRTLLESCQRTLEKIDLWRATPGSMASDEVRYGYLEIEDQWTRLANRQDSVPEPQSTVSKPDNVALERQKLIWQLRLEGLFLIGQADPRVVEAGQLRLLVLEHWGVSTEAPKPRP